MDASSEDFTNSSLPLSVELFLCRVYPGCRRRHQLWKPVSWSFPVVFMQMHTTDPYHEVDSSEMAFHIAGSLAFKEAMQKGAQFFLSPSCLSWKSVSTPEDYMGDVIGDINSVVVVSRVWMTSAAERWSVDSYRWLKCSVTQQTFVLKLRDGNYSMFFDKYEQVRKTYRKKFCLQSKIM